MTDIMVDLETLDTAPTGTILSIGACRVNWREEKIDNGFYVVICSDSCKARGFTESESTKKWWAQQDERARQVFTDPDKVSIDVGLSMFRQYLQQYGTNSVELWGNGSDFDNVMLANAYKVCGIPQPWRFYNNRCFRTVRKLLGHNIVEPVRSGIHHNALDDAVYQANILLMLKGALNR